MSDPKVAQKAQSIAQDITRKVVEREVTLNLKGVRTLTPVDEAFVRAVYNPDRRLG